MTALEFRARIDAVGKFEAAKEADASVKSVQQADALIYSYVMQLLDADEYQGAAIVLWGDKVFNPRPKAVRKIWQAIRGHTKTLIQGCASVGKSYSAVVYFLLDWWRDPEFTSVKIISTTAGHAKSNTFSTIVRLWKSAIIKMPGEATSDYLGLDTKEKKSGIAIVAIPTGDDGKGRLQGFHPDPRPKPHPKLGPSSRVRAFIDECEETPLGIWEGIDNMLVSQDEDGEGHSGTIKVVGAFNPKDPTSKTAQNAEPLNGWDSFDVERGVRGKNEWVSKNGWFVLRIDGKRTENVANRSLVFPGFMTYRGYLELLQKDGGNSISYYTFGRGAYPPEGSVGIIISSSILNGAKGEFIFQGSTINVGGVDIAVDGRDNCVLTKGRSGLAIGFRPAPRDGKTTPPIRFKEPRKVIQLDQQFTLRKGETKIVGDTIMTTAIKLGIAPEYLSVDRTGNGASVHDYLRAIWSAEVQGVDFSKPATGIKILDEDQRSPEELYEGIVTEVWFAMAKLMEFGYLAVSPGIRRDPFESEVLGRKCVLGAGKLLRVEKKDDFIKRLGHSPDFGDSATICVHAVRFRGKVMGSMLQEKRPAAPKKPARHGIPESVQWFKDSEV